MAKINLNIEANSPEEFLEVLRSLVQNPAHAFHGQATVDPIIPADGAKEDAAPVNEEKPKRSRATKPKAEPEVNADPDPEDNSDSDDQPTVTVDQLRKAATELAQKDRTAIQAIVTHFGAPKITAIPEEDMAEAFAMIVDALANLASDDE